MLCGLQASGKSTYAMQRFAATHEYVSKDRMRNTRRKGARQAAAVSQYLASGRPVVVDNTNPTVEDRRGLIALGRRHGARVTGYWFKSSVRESMVRNAQREGRAVVPEVGILATAKRFQPPTPEEGYDELFVVCIGDEHRFEVRPWTMQEL